MTFFGKIEKKKKRFRYTSEKKTVAGMTIAEKTTNIHPEIDEY